MFTVVSIWGGREVVTNFELFMICILKAILNTKAEFQSSDVGSNILLSKGSGHTNAQLIIYGPYGTS